MLLSHVADTLDRHAFEEQLRDERDRFVALFENVPDALVSARYENGEPIVDRVNPAFEDTFGYAQADIAQEPLIGTLYRQQRPRRLTRSTDKALRARPSNGRSKRRTVEGLRDFMVRVVPIEQDPDRTRIFGLYTDITEQKQRQQRLQILNRVLRHDLRNSMNIISGSAEMLAEAVETGDAEYAEAIQERADELLSLAEKTRAVERTLGREDTTAATVNLVDCVGRAIDRVTANYEGINIVCNTPEEALAGADDYLENAVFHLLENAVEHNDADTPRVTVTISEVDEEDDTLAVSIADNGPGLPKAERELLQEDKEITQLRHASGLGLWLVNWVITQSGGRLVFEENDPRGTVVTFTLPTGSFRGTESPPGATASN
ncbi:MAG: PAS domain-containing sensor histidine kinase [Natrialbaceae archaeon]|nr:PAS domain-containing sensor histidine kinase [Natrialbaceae archaeon]